MGGPPSRECFEQIIINNVPAQEAFDAVAATLTEEAKPVIEALQALA